MRRFEHTDRTHVFASESFRSYGNLDIFSRNDLCIDHSRCIVTGVSTANRIFYYGFSQISFVISAANSFIDSICQISAYHMYVLTDFQENTGHTGILTDRYTFIVCDLKVLDDIVQNSFCNLTVFTGTAVFNRAFYIFRKMLICFDTKLFHYISDLLYVYLSHSTPLLFILLNQR